MFSVHIWLVILFSQNCYAIQCLDHENNPVDWYVLYKLPRTKHSSNTLIKKGFGYTFITSNDVNDWKLSSVSINSSNSIVGLTLKPFYDAEPNVFHILYNDQPPNKHSNGKKGHTKGIILGNETGGLWIIHSVPLFPPAEATYSYPFTGTIYGQSFLCISLNATNLDRVGVQLQYNQPQIYTQNIAVTLRYILPNLYNAAQGFIVQSSPWYHALNLTSKSGTNFLSFAKSRQFGKELYADWISPYLNTSLMVESWLNGAGKIPSECGRLFKVNNVALINIKIANLEFKSSLDHSKWAVSNISQNWICIGDINREEHQSQRGGGTLCLKNKYVYNAYRNTIESFEKCH